MSGQNLLPADRQAGVPSAVRIFSGVKRVITYRAIAHCTEGAFSALVDVLEAAKGLGQDLVQNLLLAASSMTFSLAR